ncbi:hypothetical protein J4H86_23570 [Spiractinospora alimapuensis]|uniref:hypothetical protein n=1 Tax=Spiractinospora alimapuensis TaxID=2820884 RepID=UPI001F43F130|nr:hypothetical protein [Spiractinospora alimapuensis]QVQ51715.1 hypothetical protein J4H86_23570 [Spiractinospora alimapuensis]
MKRFLIGTLINGLIALFGYLVAAIAFFSLIDVSYRVDDNPLRTFGLIVGVIGGVGAVAAFSHVRLTCSSAVGPVYAVLGACCVTTCVYGLLSVPVLMQISNTSIGVTMIATSASGALLGGSIGVLHRSV